MNSPFCFSLPPQPAFSSPSQKRLGVYFQAGSSAKHSRSSLKSCLLRCASAGAPNPAKTQQKDFNIQNTLAPRGPLHPFFLLLDTGTFAFHEQFSPGEHDSLVSHAWGRSRGSLHHREKSRTSRGGSVSRAAHRWDCSARPPTGLHSVHHNVIGFLQKLCLQYMPNYY